MPERGIAHVKIQRCFRYGNFFISCRVESRKRYYVPLSTLTNFSTIIFKKSSFVYSIEMTVFETETVPAYREQLFERRV